MWSLLPLVARMDSSIRRMRAGRAGAESLDCAPPPGSVYIVDVSELVFEVTQDADGGYSAECLTENIFTQGDSWEELRANVREAVTAFFFDRPAPERVRLHLVRDEMLASA